MILSYLVRRLFRPTAVTTGDLQSYFLKLVPATRSLLYSIPLQRALLDPLEDHIAYTAMRSLVVDCLCFLILTPFIEHK